MRVVIALGGNAMTAPDGSARPNDQREAIERAMSNVIGIVADGHQVVLTHGNGPQVGNLLVKNELAAHVVPPVGLDWCVAQTQATIGVLMVGALERRLDERGLGVGVAAVVSRTLVNPDDPGFTNPSKPIGRYVSAPEAARMMAHGQTWRESSRGWRRVVASPEPVAVLDKPTIEALLHAGFVVVCSGGGGIPVVPDGASGFRGVEAVIDKDLTAALLALSIGADALVIATDVAGAALDWGRDHPQLLAGTTPTQLREYASKGQFETGSMAPKVEAVARFAEKSSGFAAITSLDHIADALAGSFATIVKAEQ